MTFLGKIFGFILLYCQISLSFKYAQQPYIDSTLYSTPHVGYIGYVWSALYLIIACQCRFNNNQQCQCQWDLFSSWQELDLNNHLVQKSRRRRDIGNPSPVTVPIKLCFMVTARCVQWKHYFTTATSSYISMLSKSKSFHEGIYI